MKRKFIASILIAAMLLSLTACSKGSDSSDTENEQTQTTTEPEKTNNTNNTESPQEAAPAPEIEQVIAPYETDLQSGAYYVGLHIPEGFYNVTVNSGLGNILTKTGVHSAMGSGTGVEYAMSYNNLKLANGDILKVTQSLNIKISTQEAYYSTMKSYNNPAAGEMELSAGTYSIGQDVPAGLYDMTIVSGTVNANTSDFSFSTMLTDDALFAESASSSYKNVELLQGQTLTVQSGTVKITATPNIVPLTP